MTSVGTDSTSPKPKPPPLTPKPAPSEIVKRLSFKRDTVQQEHEKRVPAPEVILPDKVQERVKEKVPEQVVLPEKKAPEPPAKPPPELPRESPPKDEVDGSVKSSPFFKDSVMVVQDATENTSKPSPFHKESVKPLQEHNKHSPFHKEPVKPLQEEAKTLPFQKKSVNSLQEDNKASPFPKESFKPLQEDVKHSPFHKESMKPLQEDAKTSPFHKESAKPFQEDAKRSPFHKDSTKPSQDDIKPFHKESPRPSFRLDAPSQAPHLEHASPPPSLFESLPSVEYSRLEQEFDKLAGGEEEEDLLFMDEESASEPIVDTPRRPSQLDIPSRNGGYVHPPSRRQGTVQEQEEQPSPETPSYSSRPLPLSPSGPLLANISISSPESSEAPDLSPAPSPAPAKNKPSAHTTQPLAPPPSKAPASSPPSSPPALPSKPAPTFLTPAVPASKQEEEEAEDEFQDELHFDPTISSGHCGVLGGGFRSTPVTVGVCSTPQPLTPAPTPRPEAPEVKVEDMTPTEAEVLLADRLMERRSRAGSVLSDEQAEEVERLLSPGSELESKPKPPERSSSREETEDSGAPSLESLAVGKLESLVYSREESKSVNSDYVSADSYQLAQDSPPQPAKPAKPKPDAEPNPECYYDEEADVHYFTDGHYWFETNSIDKNSPLETSPAANLHYKPPSRY